MEKVPSTHRFQVAKVEFADETDQQPEPTEAKVNENGSIHESIDSPTSVAATFTLPYETYLENTATNLKTFGRNTTEALPHVDHYRNLLSATTALKSRPTLAELHEEKDDIDRQRHREPLLSITEASLEENKEKQSAVKFGWVKGVLIRCLLNIWGVMLFLRLSWVTGQAGIGLGTAVVLLSTVVTVITSLSMSAICTNGIVRGGGAYYMISRSLGPEYGGAIGLIFSVANAVAVSMYVVGFAETVRDILKVNDILMTDEVNDIRIIGVITITLLLAIAIIGMEWEARAQVVLLVILLVAIANFVIGTFIPPSQEKMEKGFVGYTHSVFVENLAPAFRDGESFFSVFAIFFPAATGVLAGSNISGDLKYLPYFFSVATGVLAGSNISGDLKYLPYFFLPATGVLAGSNISGDLKYLPYFFSVATGVLAGSNISGDLKYLPYFFSVATGVLAGSNISGDLKYLPYFFSVATGVLAGSNISGDLKYLPYFFLPATGVLAGSNISGDLKYLPYFFSVATGVLAGSNISGDLKYLPYFFLPATGVLAGSNISGDLKNPQVDIPKGTILAIVISTCSYILVLLMLGGCLVRDATGAFAGVISQIMEMVSGFGPLITAGIFSATLSSALASLVSAPKVFQALCKDRIFPKIFFFAQGYGTGDNPRRAYVLAYIIGVAFILIGDLNAIAPIISNFFLMAYTLINYSCFDNSLAKSPGWRPSFKYYSMWLSLIGALLCIAVMFVINWWTALITFAVVSSLFVYVHYSKPDVNWGSSSQAHVYKSALQSTLKLISVEDHIKNFRPQVLVLTGFPCSRPELIYFVNSLTKKISLMVCGHIIQGDHSETLKDYRRYRRGYVNKWLSRHRIKAFYSVTTAPNFRLGAQSLLQNVGVGKLKPNILIMGFKSTWKTETPDNVDAYFNIIHDAFDYEYGVGILRVAERMYREPSELSEEDNLCPRDAEETNYDAEEEESPPGSPTRRNSSPEIETPSKDFEMTALHTPEDLNKNLNHSMTVINDNIHFSKKQKGTIDVWWLFDDGGLTLLVPYILQTKSQWHNCGLRVFTAGTKRGGLVREQRQMAQLLSKFRIECQDMKIITDIGKLPTQKSQEEFRGHLDGFILNEDQGETHEEFPWKTTEDEMLLLKEKTNRQMRLRELLQEHSSDASLIVMTLPVPRKGTCSSSLYMAWLETLTRGMPPILLLRGNQSSVLTFYS